MNTIAIILKTIAWIVFVGGFFAGIVLGRTTYEWSFIIALAYWVGAFISGIFFLGFAEIISLLQKLVDKNSVHTKYIEVPPQSSVSSASEQFTDLPKL